MAFIGSGRHMEAVNILNCDEFTLLAASVDLGIDPFC
jgi:hypothetical protein